MFHIYRTIGKDTGGVGGQLKGEGEAEQRTWVLTMDPSGGSYQYLTEKRRKVQPKQNTPLKLKQISQQCMWLWEYNKSERSCCGCSDISIWKILWERAVGPQRWSWLRASECNAWGGTSSLPKESRIRCVAFAISICTCDSACRHCFIWTAQVSVIIRFAQLRTTYSICSQAPQSSFTLSELGNMLQLSDQRSTKDWTTLFLCADLLLYSNFQKARLFFFPPSFSDFTKRVIKRATVFDTGAHSQIRKHSESWPSQCTKYALLFCSFWPTDSSSSWCIWQVRLLADHWGFSAVASWHTLLWHHRDRAELEYVSSMLGIFSQR